MVVAPGSVVVGARGMWDLPGPEIEPTSPALASGFLATVSLGKSKKRSLKWTLSGAKCCRGPVLRDGGHAVRGPRWECGGGLVAESFPTLAIVIP